MAKESKLDEKIVDKRVETRESNIGEWVQDSRIRYSKEGLNKSPRWAKS